MAEQPSPRNVQDWSAVRALFEACLDLEHGARAQRLGDAAPEVRSECEALLAAHDANRGRLDPDVAHRQLLESAAMLVGVGSRIGEFRVQAVLGRGGMGTVLLAEQDSPRRRVALKLLCANASDDLERRFRHEAELLGRLRHAGIAQVFAVGVHEQDTPFGRVRWPFFAMEYVEGARTLGVWATEEPRSEAQCIAAFLEVCAAIQHAHERGVVHRDLKPQNVLVDPAGAVKVIDFGIARSLAPDGNTQRALTSTGEMLGTLRYMSPEQVCGDSDEVDTRTDVHALGVVLYELLTGRLPFDLDGRSLPEVGRILAEVEAAPLRSVLTTADPDLELILATALAKDPRRRYATAGSLAEDLQRYLRREPINARAPSLGYQLRLFARRRRGLVAAGAALLLVASAGLATSLAYAYRARASEQKALDEGDRKADAAQRVFGLAMSSVLDVQRRLEGLPGATGLRREIFAQAMQQLEFVERTVPLDRGMRRAMARAHLELGTIQGSGFSGHVGDREGALASFARAHSHLDFALAAGPDDATALGVLVDLELAHGQLLFDMRRDLQTAQQHWDVAAATIARLRSMPGVPGVPGADLRRAEATLLAFAGLAAQMRGELESAGQQMRSALELRLAMLEGRTPDAPACREIGSLWRSIARIEELAERPDEARTAYERAIDLLRLSDRQPQDLALRQLFAMVRSEYGYLLVRYGHESSGEAELRWSRAELVALRAEDPDNAGVHTTLGTASQRLAEYLTVAAKYAADRETARGHYTEARQFASDGLALARALRERSPDMVSVFLVSECERLVALCDEQLR